MICAYVFCFKQWTAYELRISDWSSHGCSADLNAGRARARWWRAAPRARMSGVSSTVLSSQFEADADAIGAPEQVIERLVGRRRRIGAACRPRRDHRRVLVQEVVHREVKFEQIGRAHV